MDKAKVKLISNLPTPMCVKDIQSFLGHAGFYRRFIKDFSAIARSLRNFLTKDSPLHGHRLVRTPLINSKLC